uniref:Major facilitator superfamily (MFS) profile domain-containing protein n=1 Tax=Lygus hesperus TaxID=30085 RepID=A0A0K8SZ97_LYGHE
MAGSNEEMDKLDKDIKLYGERWWMLAMFMAFSTTNAFQWSQYAVVEDVILDYYNIDSVYVEWTTMSYPFCLSVFIIPWAWLLQKVGFRKIFLLASWFNTIGAVLKLFSSSRSSFMIAFVGQWFVAAGQLGYLPSRVAALWFGADEISTACSLGVIGNQLGAALGFVFPPLFIKMNEDKEVTRSQINFVNYTVASCCIAIHVILFVFLKEEPEIPPSRAALEQRREKIDFAGTLKRLGANKGYLLLAVVYGINMGVFTAFATFLNRMVLRFFPDAADHVGWIGLILILCGGVGTFIAGCLLDKFGGFKEFSILYSICSALSCLAIAQLIDQGVIALIYISAGATGFFMTGYFTIGFEYGAELAYPENEGTSLGMLNAIPQAAAIGSTLLGSKLIEWKGVHWCLYGFCLAMIAASVIASTIPKDYRRRAMKTSQEVEKQANGVVSQQEMKPLRPEENHV